jgi:hypothetical protein
MRALLFFLSVSFFLFASPAQAARFSGSYLYQLCAMDKDGKEMVQGGHTACQSYIAGVIDYHSVLQSMKIAPRVDICIPRSVTSAQLHSVVL